MDPGRDHLVLLSSHPPVAYPLDNGWTKVGRTLSADIRLDDPSVSRRHALVAIEPNRPALILDDRSLNGILLNGEPIERAELKDGDLVAIGIFRLVYLERGSTDIPAEHFSSTEQDRISRSDRDPLSLGRVPQDWDEAIGPMRTASEVDLQPPSSTGAGIATAARTVMLLFATDESGEDLYPAFQFDEDNRPFPAIEPCLREFLAAELDPYTTAAWFVTSQQNLSGLSPVDWMRDGRADNILIDAARRSAALYRR